jgi:hypothetical protein
MYVLHSKVSFQSSVDLAVFGRVHLEIQNLFIQTTNYNFSKKEHFYLHLSID